MQLTILVSGITLLCFSPCSSLVTPTSVTIAKDEKPRDVCRTRDILLPPDLFALHTCAMCYMYMLPSAFSFKADAVKLNKKAPSSGKPDLSSIWQLKAYNKTFLADPEDPKSPLLHTFRDDDEIAKWKTCCSNAKDCCERMMADITDTETGWCPRTWDGWLCWEDAPPTTSKLASCPDFIALGSDPPSCMFASKTCEDGGHWYRSAKGDEWTNYSTCSLLPNFQKRAYVSIGAYAVTIVALVPALIILSAYRQLRVPRVALHRQLFASLLLNAIAVITFKSAVLLPATLQPVYTPFISQDSVLCKVLLVATKYLRLTNYMWMFCEGFYLHRLISAAFVEHTSLWLFYFIGWGLPLIPVGVYVLLRLMDNQIEHSAQCWAFPQGLSEWVFYVPCLLSLALNLVFLVDIIRILWLKLRARHQDEPSQYRKAVRATLVLVPLFGLHLTLTMYRPASGPCSGTFIQWYYMADYLLDGLQGFLVALSFCYCNGEVHSLLRRSYQRYMQSHSPGLMLHSLGSAPAASHTTVSVADPNRRARHISSPVEIKAEPIPETDIMKNGETDL